MVEAIQNGETSSVDGTSAASPTIAGLVGLINSARIQQGKPTVGFLNPLLYAAWTSTNGAAFNDITIGNNACTEQGCFCKTGFQATSGWDASSGLGTPNLGQLAIQQQRKTFIV
jgi:subtilase family serine protease